MIDMGQYLSAADRRDMATRGEFAGQCERALRNLMLEERDIERAARAERLWRKKRARRLAAF